MEHIDLKQCRRLALARAGLLKPEWTQMPRRATGLTQRARQAAHRIIHRFGYLQLDTVAVAGARSHAIVLLSRLKGFDPCLAEMLLQPGEPLFEYWGHEACWMPMEQYPVFAFRRQDYQCHPWWGDLIGQHPHIVNELTHRIKTEGPIRSLDMAGRSSRGWWDLKLTKKVATALWSAGIFAIRKRQNFHREYDLAENVIPEKWRNQDLPKDQALEWLILKALQGHGWATTATLSQTWRLSNARMDVQSALKRLMQKGAVLSCALITSDNQNVPGWIRPKDLELAHRLHRVRPVKHRGVLLSPFDPLLWDRKRVKLLFDFKQILEIFKPADQRIYGYYCLPVLAGENLVARVDLKANRKNNQLKILSYCFESETNNKKIPNADREALQSAIIRYAHALNFKPVGRPFLSG